MDHTTGAKGPRLQALIGSTGCRLQTRSEGELQQGVRDKCTDGWMNGRRTEERKRGQEEKHRGIR